MCNDPTQWKLISHSHKVQWQGWWVGKGIQDSATLCFTISRVWIPRSLWGTSPWQSDMAERKTMQYRKEGYEWIRPRSSTRTMLMAPYYKGGWDTSTTVSPQEEKMEMMNSPNPRYWDFYFLHFFYTAWVFQTSLYHLCNQKKITVNFLSKNNNIYEKGRKTNREEREKIKKSRPSLWES